jgi:hypothetical protein
VVDTNVATTANGNNEAAPDDCIAASARALAEVMKSSRVFIDDDGRIVREYRANLSPKGAPGPGDAFLKWVLTHEWGGHRITRVAITAKPDDPEDFEELPIPSDGTMYDRSDRKFLAVSAATPERPVIIQSLDSKWWGWRDSLGKIGVRIHFVCPDAISAKYSKKMGK